MAFARIARRPMRTLVTSRMSHWCNGGGYSCSSYSLIKSHSRDYDLSYSVRRFSSSEGGTVGVSDQMNLIRQLRERTSAPIKDVKASLISCNWDIEAAQKDLRKRGVALASKKSVRTAAEGLLALAQNETKAVIIELNCETDFVARNEIFQYLASSLAKLALSAEISSPEMSGFFPLQLDHLEHSKIMLDHPKISGETTIQSAITEVTAMMGENIKLRRGFAISTPPRGILSTYLHMGPQPGLGRIAGIISLESEADIASSKDIHSIGSDLAMHVVATKPLFLTKELVSSDAIQSEREILKSQAESSGKPQMAIEKMVEGRLRKYLEEVVLEDQKFVKDDSLSVKDIVKNLSKNVGSAVKIGSFFRMEVGEGIQRLEASEAADNVAKAV